MVLTPEEATQVLVEEYKRLDKETPKSISDVWEAIKPTASVGTNYGAYSKDVYLAGQLVAGFGSISAQAVVKEWCGKSYIVLKGYPGLRRILKGTRYGLENPKVVQMGIGKHGLAHSMKSGMILSVVLCTAFRVTDYLLRDSATMHELIGGLGVDLVKVGVASGVAWGLAAASGAMSAIVLLPIAVAIVFGVGLTLALNVLDEKYGITEKVIQSLELSESYILGQMKGLENKLIDTGKMIVEEITYSIQSTAITIAKRYIINNLNELYVIRIR